jgi:cysteine desulfurase
MGVEAELARGAVRVSMGATTQLDDVKRFLEVLRETLLQLRQLTAVSI